MNENEIIMNEDVVNEAMEAIPENAGVNLAAIGVGVLVAGAVAALGYKIYKLVKEKKAREAREADCVATVDPINDFDDEESAE